MHIFKVMDLGPVFRIEFLSAIILVELVRFRNTKSSFSFLFPAISLPLSCPYSNINVENNKSFSTISDRTHP